MKKVFASKKMMRISGTKVLTIDAVDVVRFRMEQSNLRQSDLIPYFGSRSRVSEFLSRKRSPSLSHLRNLHFGLGIPAEVLLQYPKYPTQKSTTKPKEGSDVEKLLKEMEV